MYSESRTDTIRLYDRREYNVRAGSGSITRRGGQRRQIGQHTQIHPFATVGSLHFLCPWMGFANSCCLFIVQWNETLLIAYEPSHPLHRPPETSVVVSEGLVFRRSEVTLTRNEPSHPHFVDLRPPSLHMSSLFSSELAWGFSHWTKSSSFPFSFLRFTFW